MNKQAPPTKALSRALFFGVVVLVGISGRLCAQPTNTTSFDLGVLPTNGSIMISESTNAVFVTITNYDAFTNITVTGDFDSQTNISFLDDGQPPDTQEANGTFSARLIVPLLTTPTTLRLTLVASGELPPTEPPQDPLPPPVVQQERVDYIVLPRPSNDKFTNAYRIPAMGGLLLSSNTYASMEAGEPRHGKVPSADASVWWNWSAGTNGNVLADLAGSSFDGVLAVYQGTSVSNLVEVKSGTNDVVNKLRAHVNFVAQKGITYRIAVAGFDTNATGDVRLRVVPAAYPDTNGPLVSIRTPASESLVTSELVQFAGAAKERLDTETGVERVILQVNNDTNTLVARGTTDWDAVVTLPVGTNLVRARAIDYAGNMGPPAAVVVRYINPINDLFERAILLEDVGGIETADNTHATKELNEPFHAENEGGCSIWYAWRAPRSGELFLTTEGSSCDTLLALYVGTRLDNLQEVNSNDEQFPGSGYSGFLHKVVANQLYYIAVDGFGGQTGQLVLSYSFNTTEVFYSLEILSSMGGTVSPPAGLYSENEQLLMVALPARSFEFVRWEDATGGPLSIENPFPIVMDRNRKIAARFQVKEYTETFRSGDLAKLAWATSSHAPWTVQSVAGQFAARSGAITHGQSTSLILVTNTYAGFGSFDCMTSSEEGWDRLEFYVNGALLGRWSGEQGWESFMFTVPEGPTAFEWRYVKDNNFSAGLDAVFVDNVYLPLDPPLPPATRPSLELRFLANQVAQIILVGQPNVSYVLQISSDLSDWFDYATNSSPGAALEYIDSTSPEFPLRFYRARTR